MKACHGPGKSFTAGRLVAWWIDTHPHGEAFAVTTAPTDPQVKAILWREITRAHKKGHLPGRVTQDAQWKIDNELVGFGRKPADHDENGFQGIHDRYLLAVLDEACGIVTAFVTLTTAWSALVGGVSRAREEANIAESVRELRSTLEKDVAIHDGESHRSRETVGAVQSQWCRRFQSTWSRKSNS